MKMNLYVILDRVAEESGPVFEAVNDGVALRNVRVFLSKAVGAEPRDFCLLRLATVDHTNNRISCEADPVVVDQPLELEKLH